MDTPVFADPDERPSDPAIRAALGRAAAAWGALFERLRAEHPDVAAEWRYYADGKSWLLKVTRGKQTMCWIAVEKGGFRVTFYFAPRHTDALLASELSDERKAELRAAPATGTLRAVTVRFGARRGVDDVLRLLALKRKL